MDWGLAAQWETNGIPLRIVLRAMDDALKKHADQKRKDSINSLRYFTPAVEREFADWQTSQVGKSVADTTIFRKTSFEETDMQNLSAVAMESIANENISSGTKRC